MERSDDNDAAVRERSRGRVSRPVRLEHAVGSGYETVSLCGSSFGSSRAVGGEVRSTVDQLRECFGE